MRYIIEFQNFKEYDEEFPCAEIYEKGVIEN